MTNPTNDTAAGSEASKCKHCDKTKRGHMKANRGNIWFCNGGRTIFEPVSIPSPVATESAATEDGIIEDCVCGHQKFRHASGLEQCRAYGCDCGEYLRKRVPPYVAPLPVSAESTKEEK